MASFNVTKHAFAREHLTITSTTVPVVLTESIYSGLTATYPSDARRATGVKISVEAAGIRYTEDGTDPVVTGGSEVGSASGASDVLTFDSYEAIKRLKFVKQSSNAHIEVVYYR